MGEADRKSLDKWAGCFNTKQDVDFCHSRVETTRSHNRAYSRQVRAFHYELRCVCHPNLHIPPRLKQPNQTLTST